MEMEEKVGTVETEKVYTRQEVEDIVAQINNQARTQCENIIKRCKVLEEQLLYKRLDYLFKVVENSSDFKMEFIQKCTEEIESLLTIDSENEQEDTGDTVKE